MNKIDVLGVHISSTSLSDLLKIIVQKVKLGTKFYIVTPNPELIVASTKNNKLKKALNEAEIAIPDGIGLRLAKWDLNIIKGRELFMDLIKLANEKSWRVFLLGGIDNEALLTIKKLSKKYKKVKFDYAGGPKVTTELYKDAVDKINKFNPHFLFVAFGNPKQEIWIYENLSRLNVKCVMAVGGTFRYIGGLSKMPPDLISSLGLEWLWRLVTEPKRYIRILNAVVVFPLRFLMSKL